MYDALWVKTPFIDARARGLLAVDAAIPVYRG